jgi:hypothetical protein
VKEVEARLADKLRHLGQSSSIAEMINGKVRPFRAIKKRIIRAMLNLIALKHNLTAFERSAERQGRSLYRMLGVRL